MSLRAALATLALSSATPALAAPPAIVPAPPNAQDVPIALLVDLSSGQTLFAREADRRFMPASITKVMTTYVAFERMAKGQLFPQQITAMQPETFKRWNRVGSTMYLGENAPVTIDALLHGVTTVSANDGAVVLGEAALGSLEAWVAEMNRAARAIGMRDSHFGGANGWMDEGHTFTTARDLVALADAMVTRHPAYYRHFVGAASFAYNGISQRNHDPLLGEVRGADGIKTGFTNQAGYGFLGSAQRGGRRLVMVVAGSPTGRQRNAAAKAFMEWGFSAFDSRILFPADRPIGSARVQGGGLRRVDLVPRRPVRLALGHGARPKVTMKLHYEGPLRAPIARGQQVAQLHIFLDGRQVSALPLVARTAVASATPLQRMFNGIAGWMPWS
ncbi:D-alanyl-D-alanine carboxypeptidase family protein [Qipengyuania sediminis]|uniref:D-alanyl-D-alanine carboxypeptidase family protein n=1 Tax=Qipengyuania sediminis TaxID=1532023 RepID=UPI001F0D9B6C|nr:D-alanyl-D-alanine carboxypeptidase family protein [Qipengyuania sediminis]